jgi:hypothetical protein
VRLAGLAICLCIAATGCGATIIKNDVSGPVAACDSFAYASCNRLSQCQPNVSVDNCAQLLSANQNCSSATCLPDVYSISGAQACLDAYNTQSCSDAQANAVPAACNHTSICVAP